MRLLSADYCSSVCERIHALFPSAPIIADELALIRHFPLLYITLGTVHESHLHAPCFRSIPPIYLTEPPPRSPSFTLALAGPSAGYLEPFLIDAPIRIIGTATLSAPSRPTLYLSE